MIKSMTAFGRAKAESAQQDITVEIKSVNSRFYDCNVKIPRIYSFLEERIKNYVKENAVSRAKVDVYITIEDRFSENGKVDVDYEYAESYINALRNLCSRFDLKDDISVMSVARNTDVFKAVNVETDLEKEWLKILPALDGAISDYVDMREKEGEKMFSDLKQKVEHVRFLTDKIEEFSKSDTSGYREKLENRIRQILKDNSIEVDENRLLTECAIWADKIAIDEELVRLRSHFGAFYDIADSEEPSGRKLDFLMQEMNRETNTIGSKANNSSVARTVVEIKGELEKIREQVQNIE